jgi:PPK2 family polyphosphate:nucleotide phosphotransferase
MKELKRYRIKPGHRVQWHDVDPGDTGSFDAEEESVAATDIHIAHIASIQRRLFAEGKQSLLVVLQAMDTGGKDGTIRHLAKGLNPAGCQVTSFKAPTPDELSHDFLWRVHPHAPAKGMIAIFNRSHYEDVLITRVHELVSDREARRRLRDIAGFEHLLAANGTTILKFFLAISKDEQRARLKVRIDDPDKRWKFDPVDLKERRRWDRYQEVYADAIAATSTNHAPWYIIPANHKWYRNYLVSKIIATTLEKMNPQYPTLGPLTD